MPRLLAPRYWGAHLLAVVAVAAAVLLGRVAVRRLAGAAGRGGAAT